MKRYTLPLLLATCLSVINLTAQLSSWEKDLSSDVYWQRSTTLGNLVVSTSNGMQGINPETGDVIWSNEKVKSSDEKEFDEIPNSPFFGITKGNEYSIVNSFDGNLNFSSTQSGLSTVDGSYFLHKSGYILVFGKESGSKIPTLHMIEIKSGKKVWSKPSSFGVITSIKDIGNGECLVTTGFFLVKIDLATGNEVWKKTIDPAYQGASGFLQQLEFGEFSFFNPEEIAAAIVLSPYDPDIVIVGVQAISRFTKTDSDGKTVTEISYSRNYMAFDKNSGEAKWGKIVTHDGPMGLIYTGEDGLIVGEGEYPKKSGAKRNMLSKSVQCLDYQTGEGKWGKKGKGINVKGTVLKNVTIFGDKLILVSGKINNFVDIVNPKSSESYLKKAVKVTGQITYLSLTDAGLFYITDKDQANLINTSQGGKIWKKSYKTTKKLTLDDANEITFFDTKLKQLITVDKTSGVVNELPAEVKFTKESPQYIEKLDNGYLIMSDQNMALIANDGSLVYHKYFPPVKEDGWKQALYYTQAVFSIFSSMVYSFNSGLYGAVSQSIQVNNQFSSDMKDATQLVSDAYGDAADSEMDYAVKMIKQASKRFKASQNKREYVFILTSPDKKTSQLVRVNKASGEVESTIELGKEKKPSYQVDAIENRVFVRTQKTVISAFDY